MELTVPPELRERIPADPGQRRLGDGEDGCRRERGVDGVPTLLERAHAGPGREWMARREERSAGDGGKTREAAGRERAGCEEAGGVQPHPATAPCVSLPRRGARGR